QRQRRVCRRDAVHVVDLAVSGQPSVEVATVPRGHAFGAIAGILGRHIGAAVDAVGLADAVAAAALRHRLALFNHARTVFLAGKWARAMGGHSTAGPEGAGANETPEIGTRDLPPHPTPAPRPPPRA